ncbi:hypothetical protein O3P69_000589 [Scylla paramamosain]|uniref:Uncharacterized protein n=1 Tax=Scylla paramamosain TaxID=85552 RepID=A0AAW0USV9_SCYPA
MARGPADLVTDAPREKVHVRVSNTRLQHALSLAAPHHAAHSRQHAASSRQHTFPDALEDNPQSARRVLRRDRRLSRRGNSSKIYLCHKRDTKYRIHLTIIAADCAKIGAAPQPTKARREAPRLQRRVPERFGSRDDRHDYSRRCARACFVVRGSGRRPQVFLGRHFVLLFKTHRRHTWQVITPHRWAARVSRSLSGRRLLKSAGAEMHVPPGWGVFAGCADEWSDTIGRLQHLSPAPCVITASVAGE